MKISFAVTCFNEVSEIKQLIPFLLEHKKEEDEIVILWDNKGDSQVWEYLTSQEPQNYFVYQDTFANDFAEWKNRLTNHCQGDYIFQIDCDEMPDVNLVKNLGVLLEANPEIDVILVPRENYVNGLTMEHVQRWGWKIDEQNRVNWPDLQWRIYKNNKTIYWKNKVHERLEGFKTYTHLPLTQEWSLNHTKSIQRQTEQNEYYSTL